MPRADSPLKGRVIFVVGARRSGTNWVQRILTARPDVAAMPTETYLFSNGLATLAEILQHSTPGLRATGLTFMSRGSFLDGARDFADRVFQDNMRILAAGATRVVERTPWHVYHLDLIAAVYPEAPIVHVIRDGRDVTRSLLGVRWGPETMLAAAEEWRSSVLSGRMAGASLPNYVEVRYEDLLSGPVEGIRSLYERVGLDLDGDLLDRVTSEASAEYNVDPSFPEIGTGKWRATLSPWDLQTFDRVAGELLEEVGYRREPPPRARAGQHVARTGRAARSRAARIRPRRRSREREPAALGPPPAPGSGAPLELNARAVRRLQEGLLEGRYEVLNEVLAPDATVHVVDEGRSHRARGNEGIAHLTTALQAHEELGLDPLSGHALPSGHMYTLVGTYRLGDASLWSRTLVVTFRGASVIGIALFRYRLATAPAPAKAGAR